MQGREDVFYRDLPGLSALLPELGRYRLASCTEVIQMFDKHFHVRYDHMRIPRERKSQAELLKKLLNKQLELH